METVDGRALVEAFYARIWNAGDEEAARRILAPDLEFRGSTGPARTGVDGFLGYVRLIRGALAGYECVIEELVVEGERAFAKMLFRGRHAGTFFGVAPTGRAVAWAGAALFRFQAGRIRAVWVLGDVDGLKQQLGLAVPVAP
ncbi:MAG TPA: ester cyclase [Anaeromyxobacter sp.]|nr:ester cyclase [Anaeromyxobacter sp.]